MSDFSDWDTLDPRRGHPLHAPVDTRSETKRCADDLSATLARIEARLDGGRDARAARDIWQMASKSGELRVEELETALRAARGELRLHGCINVAVDIINAALGVCQ